MRKEGLESAVEPSLKKLYVSVYKKMESRLRRVHGFRVLTGVFDDYAPLVWLDDVHVTPHGNEIIAKKMLE